MSDGRKSKVYQKAYAFSIRMIKLYQYLCEHKKEYESLFADADEIAKMLFSILKATRISK